MPYDRCLFLILYRVIRWWFNNLWIQAVQLKTPNFVNVMPFYGFWWHIIIWVESSVRYLMSWCFLSTELAISHLVYPLTAIDMASFCIRIYTWLNIIIIEWSMFYLMGYAVCMFIVSLTLSHGFVVINVK